MRYGDGDPTKPAETIGGYGPSKAPVGACPKFVGKRNYVGVIAPELESRNNYTLNTLILIKKRTQNKFFWIMEATIWYSFANGTGIVTL